MSVGRRRYFDSLVKSSRRTGNSGTRWIYIRITKLIYRASAVEIAWEVNHSKKSMKGVSKVAPILKSGTEPLKTENSEAIYCPDKWRDW
jgi:hypothetical protein